METIVEVLSYNTSPCPTSIINDEVATLLNLPDDLLQEEDANCSGSAYTKCVGHERSSSKKVSSTTQSEVFGLYPNACYHASSITVLLSNKPDS